MTPLRLLILAVLFYIGYRLLRNLLLQQLEKKTATSEKKDQKVQDVLVEDPVCHTLIPKKQAVRLRKEGETLYFCSDKCCDKYLESSEDEQ